MDILMTVDLSLRASEPIAKNSHRLRSIREKIRLNVGMQYTNFLNICWFDWLIVGYSLSQINRYKYIFFYTSRNFALSANFTVNILVANVYFYNVF